jgi:hypothetical protein
MIDTKPTAALRNAGIGEAEAEAILAACREVFTS